MRAIVALSVVLLALSACSASFVTANDAAAFGVACTKNDGWLNATIIGYRKDGGRFWSVRCNDGAIFEIKVTT